MFLLFVALSVVVAAQGWYITILFSVDNTTLGFSDTSLSFLGIGFMLAGVIVFVILRKSATLGEKSWVVVLLPWVLLFSFMLGSVVA